MSYWFKNGAGRMITTLRGNGESGRKSSIYSEAQPRKKRSNTLYGPLESHWHLLDPEKKKTRLMSRLSFRTLQKSLSAISSSGTFRKMFQGVRDSGEEKSVQSLRELLLSRGKLPEKHDDYHTLLRFLRMRNFDVSKAEEMFVNMLKWREENGIDVIAREFKFEEYEAVKRCYPHGYHGVDKYGRPLYIERIGSLDLDTLLRITTIDRYVKYHISEQEKTLNLRYPACSLAAKRHVASTTIILDVKGMGTNNFSRPARELFIEIQKIDCNYYPETLNKIFVINAGPGFKALWKVLSAFLEARTLSKIQVLGTKYLDKIAEAVDLSNVPDFIGGTCKCYEHGGCLLKDKGPWTDPEIKNALLDVFSKAQMSEDRSTNKDNFEDLMNFQTEIRSGEIYVHNNQMVEKINELEAWLLDTNQILQVLNLKQQELADYVEQLKLMT
ncbi:phosphatidylinositol/phosphatidylcholine transfer protein SFH11 isoform X1 [Canna indica]|uniref:Phosphatidylinositol/phosphatidylcholine transfer protein SFH11 isoform X1 n=1 Tax=Canna indica TaxID=4628 RepID=A0AAQ3QGN4_9LILI|nr:phosphatidylinositol/phosphatidylcholine transfer protein SFH11 isoform X1 [Canna indica]